MNKENRKKIIILFTVLMLTGLTSCRTTYKNLDKPPLIEMEGIIRDSGQSAEEHEANISNIPWEKYFTDSRLQALISEGLNNNVDMHIAMSRIRQAEASLEASRGDELPSVSAEVRAEHSRSSSGPQGKKVLGYDTNPLYLGFSASWEIDLWGKLSNKSKARYANLLNSYEYKKLVQTELIASIASGYYQLLVLDKQLDITKETVVLLEKNLETMSALKEAGEQNAAAVEKSKALLCSTKISIPDLENRIRTQENAISVLLDRKPGVIDRMSIDEQRVSVEVDSGVPVRLLANRPDVKQAEFNLLSAYAATGVAKANLYPSLTISSTSFGLSSDDITDFFKPESIVANIIASISRPMFNREGLKSDLKIAEEQQQEALLTFSNTILKAGHEVSNIMYGYKSSLRKNDIRDEQIISLKNAVDTLVNCSLQVKLTTPKCCLHNRICFQPD